MTTYICKCGQTFQKNTGAGTTGNRMSDYGPEHECFGCPFVKMVTVRDPMTETNSVVAECRGCKEKAFYGTVADCVDSKASTLHIKSLDFNFIQAMTDFYNTLDGVEHMDHPPQPGMDEPHGRLPFSFNFPQNLKGEAAKQKLIEQFFQPVNTGSSYNKMYARKDVSGCGEEFSLYRKIRDAKEEAKAMAQGKEPEIISKNYYHHNLVYFVDQREDNGQYTVFMGDRVHLSPETTSTCATIPDFPTFEQAQNALDGYAIKRGFTEKPGETPQIVTEQAENVAESEQNVTEDDESVPPAEETEEMEQQQEQEESTPEQGPCDWKNASGADEVEDDPEEPENNFPAGECVSLRDDAFSSLLDICDNKVNQALRVAMETKQGFSFNAKITFDYRGGAFAIKHETGYQFDPIKVKDKGELEEIQISIDENGNPIIPFDRQHQMTFSEVNSEKSVETTVDGSTGLVNEVHADDETEEKLYPCDHSSCPFFGVGDDESAGCRFDPKVDADDKGCTGDIWEAVTMNNCERPEVLEAYRNNDPDEDDNGPDDDDEGNADLPDQSEADSPESCNRSSCTFYEADCPHNCAFKADGEYYGALDGYPADEDDVLECVESYNCSNPELLAEYEKVKEQKSDD